MLGLSCLQNNLRQQCQGSEQATYVMMFHGDGKGEGVCLTFHSTKYTWFQRRSFQPITWHAGTSKTEQDYIQVQLTTRKPKILHRKLQKCRNSIKPIETTRNTLCGTWYLPIASPQWLTVHITMVGLTKSNFIDISTSGLKADVIIAFLDPDAKTSAIRKHLKQI